MVLGFDQIVDFFSKVKYAIFWFNFSCSDKSVPIETSQFVLEQVRSCRDKLKQERKRICKLIG